ncbi:hypothetical protein D3C86_1300340 [compost metagenome]
MLVILHRLVILNKKVFCQLQTLRDLLLELTLLENQVMRNLLTLLILQDLSLEETKFNKKQHLL